MNNAAEWLPSVPGSCCAAGTQVCTPFNAFQTGCQGAVHDFIGTSGNIIGAVALGVAGIEVCLFGGA